MGSGGGDGEVGIVPVVQCLHGNGAFLLGQQLPIIRRDKQGSGLVFVLNGALNHLIITVETGEHLLGIGYFLQHPADSGFQIPGPNALGGAVVQGVPVRGENGTSHQVLRGGNGTHG